MCKDPVSKHMNKEIGRKLLDFTSREYLRKIYDVKRGVPNDHFALDYFFLPGGLNLIFQLSRSSLLNVCKRSELENKYL